MGPVSRGLWVVCGPLAPIAISLFCAMAVVGSVAQNDRARAQQRAPNAGAAKPVRNPMQVRRQLRRQIAVPKPETLLALIRLHFVGLDQAIKARDFRVLHAISARGLRSRITPSQFAAAYRNFIARPTDLAATAITTPQITESPKILNGNILKVVGYFPTRPKRIDFHMQFQPEDRQWKLLGMDVAVKQVKPAASKRSGSAKSANTRKVKKK